MHACVLRTDLRNENGDGIPSYGDDGACLSGAH